MAKLSSGPSGGGLVLNDAASLIDLQIRDVDVDSMLLLNTQSPNMLFDPTKHSKSMLCQ